MVSVQDGRVGGEAPTAPRAGGQAMVSVPRTRYVVQVTTSLTPQLPALSLVGEMTLTTRFPLKMIMRKSSRETIVSGTRMTSIRGKLSGQKCPPKKDTRFVYSWNQSGLNCTSEEMQGIQ